MTGEIEIKHIHTINKVDKQNSFCFRYDGVGSDVKIVFDTPEELKNVLTELAGIATTANNKVEAIRQIFSRTEQ